MTDLLDSAKNYLKDTQTLKPAHLIAIELPGTTNSFAYHTDYFKDVTYNGILYKAGAIKSVGEVRQTKVLTMFNLSIKVSGLIKTELDRALESKSFLNRRIIVHKAFMGADGNYIPMYAGNKTLKFFEGTISTLSISDNINTSGVGSSTITWNCASVLYDFQKINGRITDDASHRGLVPTSTGFTPSAAAKRAEYQLDKGFLHSNTSVSILATYQTKEKRSKMVSHKKHGLGGLMGIKDYKMVEYWADVNRELNLDFNLTAKYIPVLYGVQKTSGIPIFADTDKNNPNEVWVAYAFCEGEIEGFLDIYFDDLPIICVNDTEDSESRVCIGRKDAVGDTLGSLVGNPGQPSAHGQHYVFDDENGDPIEFWTYHGKRDQDASQPLMDKAVAQSFKLQGTQGSEYWDDTFKLLDTAYIVFKFPINSDRANIPSIEAEVKGKKIPVYTGDSIDSSKTSLNLVWQTLDYLTSTTYGAAISLDRINLDSVKDSAAILDIQDTSYQAAWAPYWRYLGWPDRDNSNRQVVQGSAILDTSTTVFKNVESIISQYDASLNIISGDYYITVEAEKPSEADITFGDILDGKIDISDTTSKEKFNSVQAAITDPALMWKTNTINFFNSVYKAEDNNVESKANIVFPFITNYYTARSRTERLLKRSRYTRRITIELPFYFMYLRTNSNITVSVDRYGWDKKKFLVEDITWTNRGRVKIKAREYTDGVFLNSPQSDVSSDQKPSISVNVLPPTDLQYTPDTSDIIEGLNGTLDWAPSITSGIAYYAVNWTGSTKTQVVSLTGREDPTERIKLDLFNLKAGEYTFDVRAVSVSGQTSKSAKITVNINATKNLSNVPNFRVTNLITDSTQIFYGSSLNLAWDDITEHASVIGLKYQLQILDSKGVLLRDLEVTNANTYSYTLDMNKADFAMANSGTLGINRELQAQIKAKSGDGTSSSVQWTKL